MALDWENLLNFSNQIYPFEQHQQRYYEENNDDLFLSLETELLCYDSVPPSLLDFNDSLLKPPPPPLHLTTHHDHHLCNHEPTFDNIQLDFPPPQLLPPDDYFSINEDYYTQFLPFPKKQRLLLPCFDPKPDFRFDQNQGFVIDKNPNYDQFHHENLDDHGNSSKTNKGVSAQSRAARERRRKITEKTQELGKLVPGGSKMNTAEMLQSAFKYVKFLQTQLGILQSMSTVMENKDIKMDLDNLPLLASNVVQEKLYAKEQCLVPSGFLPIFEEQCNFDINVSTPY